MGGNIQSSSLSLSVLVVVAFDIVVVFIVVVVIVFVVFIVVVAFVNAVVLIRRTGWKWSGSVGCSSSLRFMVFFGVDPPFGGILKKILFTWVKRLIFFKIKLIW